MKHRVVSYVTSESEVNVVLFRDITASENNSLADSSIFIYVYHIISYFF